MAKKDLAVAYHQQDTDFYCGAACAQMVLDSTGAGLLDQDPLYADNHSHSLIEPNWYTGPDGLNWTLNDRRPWNFASYFVLFSLLNEDAISRKLVWTIHHYKVAPIALVYGWQHWIVIRGYEASATPSNWSDTSYSIIAFDVNNPWPPVPGPSPPPPHSASDGCGTGGVRGVADEHIAYGTWQADYMTGVPAGYWAGKFVAVCDPDPPPERHGVLKAPVKRLSGDVLLKPVEAADRANIALRELGLADRPAWKKTLRGTKAGEPYLVQRLDRLDTFYYVVPIMGATGVPAAVSIDARFGEYRQSVALHGGERSVIPELFDQTKARGLVAGRLIDLEEPLGRLLVRPEAMCVQPTLVWKPCRESFSPFFPFWMITVGGHQIYVRTDGAVFTALHTNAQGI